MKANLALTHFGEKLTYKSDPSRRGGLPRRFSTNSPAQDSSDLVLERYRYILQQIHALNENIYKILALYQSLTTLIVGAGLGLFIGYRKWGIAPSVAQSGFVGLMLLATTVSFFTDVLIIIGSLAWHDYRNEECDLTDDYVSTGFRARPRYRNFLHWYETYIVFFITLAIGILWTLTVSVVLPSMK